MAKTKAEFAGADAEAVVAKADPIVKVRVLEAGDGRISTGEHNPRGGDVLYEYEEEFETTKSIADELRARHFVELVKAPAAR